MKNFSFIAFLLSFLILSCAEKETPSLDVIITGLEDVSIKSGDEKTIPLNVTFNNDVQGSIVLSLENVPEGIQCELSKTTGVESFTAELVINVSNEAESGEHVITLKGVPNEGTTKLYTFTLEVIKNLSITFKLLNATTWTAEDPSFDVVEGAEIVLYDGELEIVATTTTNEEGIAEIYNLEEDKEYYYTTETETLGNITHQEEIEGKIFGYLVDGVFETQEEIDSSPQPSASIGDIKLADLNGDGIIDGDDKIYWKWLGYEVENRPVTVTVYLANKNP